MEFHSQFENLSSLQVIDVVYCAAISRDLRMTMRCTPVGFSGRHSRVFFAHMIEGCPEVDALRAVVHSMGRPAATSACGYVAALFFPRMGTVIVRMQAYSRTK
jgi:hypothetical protein